MGKISFKITEQPAGWTSTISWPRTTACQYVLGPRGTLGFWMSPKWLLHKDSGHDTDTEKRVGSGTPPSPLCSYLLFPHQQYANSLAAWEKLRPCNFSLINDWGRLWLISLSVHSLMYQDFNFGSVSVLLVISSPSDFTDEIYCKTGFQHIVNKLHFAKDI